MLDKDELRDRLKGAVAQVWRPQAAGLHSCSRCLPRLTMQQPGQRLLSRSSSSSSSRLTDHSPVCDCFAAAAMLLGAPHPVVFSGRLSPAAVLPGPPGG